MLKFKHYIFLGLAFFLLVASSCSTKLTCEKIHSDNNFYRASGVAFSSKEDLAYEKALNIAKRKLIMEIAKDISKKSGLSEQLLVDTIRNGIKIQDIEVVCRHNDKHKGSYKCSIAIEMSQSKFLHFYELK
jgi:hypothetical protein